MKKATVFCDIDGTILKYRKFDELENVEAELTPDALKIKNWYDAGHHIIITTARPETMRRHTEKELAELGLKWSMLIMGIGRGPRVLINDESPSVREPKALAFSLKRNEGLSKVMPACLNN